MRRSFVRRLVRRRVAQVWCSVLCTLGCADDAPSTQGADGGFGAGTAESSEGGCAAWRSASCQYISRCGKPAPSCAEQYGAIQCLSDVESEHCAEELRSAKCGGLPSECQPGTIANSASAVSGCHQYVDAVCSSAVRCGFDESAAACLEMQRLDCSLAVGLTSRFDSCLAALAAVSCQAWVPPDVCRGAVVLR